MDGRQRILVTESSLRKIISKIRRSTLIESVEYPTELYHATFKYHLNSIKKGIDPNRSTGFGQGNGFYVWVHKHDAVQHAIGLENGNFDDYKEEPLKKGKSYETMIVVIDEPIVPQNFDIDYEVFGLELHHFVDEYKKEILPRIPSWKEKIGSDYSFYNRNDSKILDPNFYFEIDDALKISRFASLMKIHTPEMFEKFQEYLFANLLVKERGALKYIGNKLIYPKRIESGGQIIWKRK